MAIRYAVANGNWNATATWDGGTLPQEGDIVYADGKTVTINQNITVASINTTIRSGGTTGGTFNCSANGWILTCDVNAGTSTCLGGGFIVYIIGNITCVSASSGIQGGTNYITGNVYGATGSAGITITLATNYITGNVYAGAAAGAHAIYNCTNFITGNVYGGNFSGGYAIQHNVTTGSVEVIGNVTANPYRAINGGGVATVIGSIQSSANDNGIVNASTVYIDGALVNVSGIQAVSGKIFVKTVGDLNSVTYNKSDGSADVVLLSSGATADFPSVDAVTKGVVFDNGNRVGTAINTEATLKTAVADIVGTLFEAYNP